MFTNAKRFCGFAYSRSKRTAEIVTSPNGEPPFGGAENSRRESAFGGGRRRCEAVLRRQRIVRAEELVDGVLERRLQAGREDGDERDEREADHQRGGGRRRP